MKKLLPLYEPRLTAKHKAAVVRQLATGWIGPGRTVEAFAKDLEHVMGRSCVVTGSGTQALLCVFWALNLKYGETVCCPDYGLPACQNAARMLGLKVKLIDVNRFTGCMSITALEKYLDSGGPCHAVVYVDHNGYTARRDDVIELCRSRSPRIPVVEDAAVALGVGDAGKRGDFSILSFSVPKIVTCGQGGAVFTDNPQYLNRLQEIIDQGGGDWRKTRVHQAVGGNFRMPDLTAALGRAQLADLDTLLGMRRRIWSWYEQDLPVFGPADDVGLNGWMVTWRAVDENHANRVIASCEMSGFEAKRLYVPVHRNKSYAGVVTDESDYEEAVAYWERTVYLPSSLTLTREQVRCICAAVNSA